MTAPKESPAGLRPAAVSAGLALGLTLWVFWPSLAEMAARWSHDPQYSHGYLVPAFSLLLLWTRRRRLQSATLEPSAWGLALLGGGLALRLAGAYFHYGYIDQIALLPCLAGLVWLAAGQAALKWAVPAIAFLAFMVPLPHSWSLALSGPMQTVATISSTFLLQVLGQPAIAEGNLIQLNEIELGIVEACSGLRMLVVFFALSTAVALLARKPLWEKLAIAASAVPIALAANILRITATGLFYELCGNGAGGAFVHDLAGWLMMPVGLAFLGLELLILQRLLLERPGGRPLPSQVTVQRVEVNPVAMYRSGNSRRDRRTVAPPPAAPPGPPAPPAVSPQAPPEPTPQSVAQP